MLASCAPPAVLAASLLKRLRISQPNMPPQQVQVRSVRLVCLRWWQPSAYVCSV